MKLLVFLALAFLVAMGNVKRPLHLMGLLPYTGNVWPVGRTLQSAMEVALREVNADPSILLDYELILDTADTQCDIGHGLRVFFQQLHSSPTKVAIVGPSCSEFCLVCARAAPQWNLTLISPSCETDRLNDRELYPNFFRTAIPNYYLGPARISWMEEFGWKKAAFIQDPDDSYSQQVANWKRFMNQKNMTIASVEVAQSPLSLHIESLKNVDARIIFVAGPPEQMAALFCEAYRLNFYGPSLQFFLPLWYADDWWSAQTFCPEENLLVVIDHAIYMGAALLNPTHTPSISGTTLEELLSAVETDLNASKPEGYSYTAYAYDAIWSVAMALNSTSQKMQMMGHNKTLDQYEYSDIDIRKLVEDSYYEVNFQGIRDRITFSDDGNAAGIVGISQQIERERKPVGYYYASNDDAGYLVWNERGVSWRGGKPPVDSPQQVIEREYVSTLMYYGMAGWAALGMVMDIALLIFNIKFRNESVIKLSSPTINNLVLIGCFVVHATVLFANTEGHFASPAVLCKIRLYTLALGFSTSFGAFFSKVWRVHVILTQSSKLRTGKRKHMSDGHLIFMVFALVLVNAIILVAWEVIDPIWVEIRRGTQAVSVTKDVVRIPEIHACSSKYKTYFEAALYGVQGLVMLFGAFLAWETREVTIEALNDSKVIGLCIYNVLVLSVVGTVITFTIENDVNMMYGFLSSLLNIGTMLTASILFIPKFFALRSTESGSKMTFNSEIRSHRGTTINRSPLSVSEDSGIENPQSVTITTKGKQTLADTDGDNNTYI